MSAKMEIAKSKLPVEIAKSKSPSRNHQVEVVFVGQTLLVGIRKSTSQNRKIYGKK
jgi:hypothetical protein